MSCSHRCLVRPLATAIVLSIGCLVTSRAESQKASSAPVAEKLKPNDKIAVVVFGEQELSQQLPVSPVGTINFPLLGQVPVANLTSEEVAKKIEALLEKDYIRDAQVSVDLVGRKAHSVMVIGQVRRPGPVEFPSGSSLDLFTAIATAGGAAEESADTSKIEVKRRKGDSIETIFTNLEKQKEFELLDSDTVIVKSKMGDLKLFTVLGQVGKPGTYPMLPDRDLDILSALAMAGGIGQMANPKKVTIRSENGESKVINVDRMQKAEIPSLILKPGDTIYVPESWF